jgi:hypothetical protein
MDRQLATGSILRTVGYITASLIVLLGIAVLTEVLFPVRLETKYRVILGVMMIAYGIVRVVLLSRRGRREDEVIND